MQDFTFLLIKNKEVGRESWWACKIATVDEFEAFLKIRSDSLLKSYNRVKQLANDGTIGHRTQEEACIELILNAAKNRCSILDDIKIYTEKFLSGYIERFTEGKTLLINRNFGFTILSNSIKILDTKHLKGWLFPDHRKFEQKIKITHWPEGKHYYAKVGTLDVVINGEQKWNSEDMAMKKAHEFKKMVGIK